MPDPQILLLLIILILCLLFLSAFFSGSESAFSTINVIRIKQTAKNPRQRKKANRVLKIIDNYEQCLATILICNNVVNISMSAIATYFLNAIMGPKGVVIGTVVITAFIIVFSEIFPKNFAKAKAESFALTAAGVVLAFMFVLSPITKWIAKLNSKIVESDEEEKLTATENELIEIVDTIEKEGVLEHNESELIKKAIVFDSKSVQSVMRKKEEVYVFEETLEIKEAIKIIFETNYSRFPVLSITTGKVIGIVQDKDLFKALSNDPDITLTQIMKPAVIVSYRRLLPYALSKLQREQMHMAIVVNNIESQKFLGIVTLEDILEELVGEIYDEHDELPQGIVTYGNHTFVVDGELLVDDLFDLLDETNNPYVDKSIDLWVRSLFKYKAVKIGSKIKYDNISITVLEIEKAVKVNDRKKLFIKKIEIVEETKI